jgi:hypothetical protein
MAIMDVAEISRMLADRVDALVPHLLSGAVREGQEWSCGGVDGSPGRRMRIHRSGPRAGVWKNFATDDQKGDALDLVAFVLFAGDKKKAVRWSKSWLGIDNLDPARLKQVQAQNKAAQARADRQALEDAARRAKRAQAIWLNASDRLQGSPVDLYLVGRGIGLAELPHHPRALRFAAALDYPADMNNGVKSSWPAMVAAICNGRGEHIATHRTFLKDHGGGLVTKAPVKDAKLSIGSYRGGFIALSRGASGKPLRDAPEGDRAMVSEGIEEGLTLALMYPEYRQLVAISVSNFQNLDLPPAIGELVIARNNDPDGSPADMTMEKALDALAQGSRRICELRPPAWAKDFNAALTAGEPLTMEARA